VNQYENPDPPEVTDATTVAYTLSSETYAYLRRLIELGAVEGSLGDMKAAEFLAPVIEALHTVMAGGEIAIETIRRGNPDILRELNERVASATQESNAINQAAGYYVTLVP
jgi:hypothetical protein